MWCPTPKAGWIVKGFGASATPLPPSLRHRCPPEDSTPIPGRPGGLSGQVPSSWDPERKLGQQELGSRGGAKRAHPAAAPEVVSPFLAAFNCPELCASQDLSLLFLSSWNSINYTTNGLSLQVNQSWLLTQCLPHSFSPWSIHLQSYPNLCTQRTLQREHTRVSPARGHGSWPLYSEN